jgi:hypothetical protein
MQATTRQQYRVAGVFPLTLTYGLSRVELAEYDPCLPDRRVMSSLVLETADVGPFAGLAAGDVLEIARVREVSE